MGLPVELRSPFIPLRRYALAAAIAWTAVLAASLSWNLYQERRDILEMARAEARVTLEHDMLLRRWNTEHGRVYVPVTETTKPNEYLLASERDITTPRGTPLTMINPEQMAREIHEMAARQSGVLGHITSLKPIRPANAPDSWEAEVLNSFERGTSSISSVEPIHGQPHLRLMRPLLAEKGCLRCHASQGYKVGDIRGGISVSVPMAPFYAVERRHATFDGVGHGALWLLGIGAIGLVRGSIRHRIAERVRLEQVVQESEQKYHGMVDSIGMGVVLIDDQMQLLEANRTMREWFPRATSEKGQVCFAALHDPPRDAPCPNCPVLLTLQDGRIHESVRSVEHPDGTRYFRLQTSPVRGSAGKVVGSIEVVEDITDRLVSERRIAAAAELVSAISPIGDRAQLLDLVVRRATDLLQADFGVIAELDPVTGAVGAAYPANFPSEQIPEGVRFTGQGVLADIIGGHPVWTPDVTAETPYKGYPAWHPVVGPCIGLPLRLLGTTLGIMLIGRTKGRRPFSEEDFHYAHTLAHHAAVAIDRTRRMEMLQTMSVVDDLTRLHNRRGFLALAEQQLKLAVRAKRGLSLLFADLDGLKWINDNLGHKAGDEALIAIARIFKDTFRQSDIVARTGGDEFAVLASETSTTDTDRFVNRLKRNLDAFNAQEDQPFQLSISVGVAYFDPDSPATLDSLLSQADRLMYQQKKRRHHT